MAKITELNQDTMQLTRIRIQDALKTIGEEFGIDFKLGKITYDPNVNSFSAKLSGALLETANGKTVDTVNATRLESLGLPMGTKLRINGKMYEVSGFAPNKPKFCILLKGLQGQKGGGCPIATALGCKIAQ